MKLIILAGGLATRLRPISEKIPKALIEVGGQPFIFWQLQLLKKYGIKDVIISCGYLGEMIENVVGNGNKFGLNINYSYDGPQLLGTGGAIKKIINILPNYFLIMYGDTILRVNFKKVQEFYYSNNIENLMVVLNNKNRWAPSNVFYKNNKVIDYNNKNHHNFQYIDYGLSILSKKSFFEINKSKFNLDLVFKNLIKKNQLSAYKANKRFYEINTITGIRETEKYLSKYINH